MTVQCPPKAAALLKKSGLPLEKATTRDVAWACRQTGEPQSAADAAAAADGDRRATRRAVRHDRFMRGGTRRIDRVPS